MKNTVAILMLALSTASCSKSHATIEEAAKAAACEIKEISTSPNIFNGTSATCVSGGRLYWFPTAEANEGHTKMCRGYGGLAKSSGVNWTWYAPSC